MHQGLSDLDTHTATITTHLEELKDQADIIDTVVKDIHEVSSGIREDIKTSKKQIGELSWLFECANHVEASTQSLSSRVNHIAELVDSLHTKRSHTDHYLNSFKKEAWGKLRQMKDKSECICIELQTQAEQDIQIFNKIKELKKHQMLDHTGWIHEVIALHKVTNARIHECVVAIGAFFTRLLAIHQAQQSAPSFSHMAVMAQDTARPPISANTIHQVFSALMSTPSHQIASAA